jgi:hypothetical protein
VPYREARRVLWAALAGLGWGAFAYGLGAKGFGHLVWVGIAASPFIGVAAARTTQRIFERVTGWRRAMTALLTLYAGAIVFALAIGVFELATRGAASRNPIEVVVETQLAILWGVSLFILMLWPLVYFTHFFIEWIGDR